MPRLIMMRHGQSQWNHSNLFTGWVDVPLSKKGIEEALEGGELIKDQPMDVIFMSSLIRSQMTAMLATASHASQKVPVVMHESEDRKKWAVINNPDIEKNIIPVYVAWQLNERMYGGLQGLNKQATIDKYGAEQVKLWRRSYDTAPPDGESLEMTAARTIPYFKETIELFLKQDKNVFISAHGNSLRSIVMHIENLSKEDVVQLEIKTGEPMIYDYSNGEYKRIFI